MQRSERLLRAALLPNQLIQKNESVVIGLSGGADSLCLLLTLLDYNRRHHQNWHLFPVHINPGFKNWKTERIERICQRLGVDCVVRTINVPKKLKDTKTDSCFFCARERRRALFQTTAELGCSKVALGHHLEDVNETFLMNLLFASAASTILPAQPLFNGALTVIRPLYYFTEDMIRARLKAAHLKPLTNRCPYQHRSMRITLRRFLKRLARRNPRIQTNLFWGIHNLKPEYLPGKNRLDRSLMAGRS
ncbi:MAG: tRNA lysidine(34) synthetase [candidate division WOR-3 bacterium]|jgi:tRNA 2-thiocytidine biosynthesis protein TtcA